MSHTIYVEANGGYPEPRTIDRGNEGESEGITMGGNKVNDRGREVDGWRAGGS